MLLRADRVGNAGLLPCATDLHPQGYLGPFLGDGIEQSGSDPAQERRHLLVEVFCHHFSLLFRAAISARALFNVTSPPRSALEWSGIVFVRLNNLNGLSKQTKEPLGRTATDLCFSLPEVINRDDPGDR